MDKILVIDDEKPTLSMFRLFLDAYGYEVLTAENGAQGLDVFRKEHPPMVLTDIKMPVMDGLEVLKAIKEESPQTEVIVITGHGDMEIAVKALNLDAADFVNKPIQKEALDAALKRAGERLAVNKEKSEHICTIIEGSTAVIELRGNITSSSEHKLISEYEKTRSPGIETVIALFNESTSINGAGLEILTSLFTESKKHDQRVLAAGMSDNFRKVFEMLGISKLADIHASGKDALSSVGFPKSRLKDN
jgi:YesN/AraC family two-component response regulator